MCLCSTLKSFVKSQLLYILIRVKNCIVCKLLEINCNQTRVPTAPGKPGKMVTVFPAWKNPGILSFLPNILEK